VYSLEKRKTPKTEYKKSERRNCIKTVRTIFELLERCALHITFLTFPVIQQLYFSQLTSQSGAAEVTGHVRITLMGRYVWKVLIFCHVYRYVII